MGENRQKLILDAVSPLRGGSGRLFMLQQLGALHFHLLLLGDIQHDPNKALRLIVRVKIGLPSCFDPAFYPVLQANCAIFHIVEPITRWVESLLHNLF